MSFLVGGEGEALNNIFKLFEKVYYIIEHGKYNKSVVVKIGVVVEMDGLISLLI